MMAEENGKKKGAKLQHTAYGNRINGLYNLTKYWALIVEKLSAFSASLFGENRVHFTLEHGPGPAVI